ncbi:MAG: DUF4321 domain-containing protein [Gemmatimonadota bacterium]
MATGPRRPRFYALILLTGFLVGGFLNAFLKHVLPDSPTKDVFTYTVSPGLGPIPINLLVLHFTLGPIQLELSPMSLIGVALAYVIARSLF